MSSLVSLIPSEAENELTRGTVPAVTRASSNGNLSGYFAAIGHNPNTDLFKGVLDLTDTGYIQTHDDVKTNIEGVYASGDVQDHIYRQAVTAAGSGCAAAILAERWLAEQGIE